MKKQYTISEQKSIKELFTNHYSLLTKKRGFTLAEVLITLVVIGVVAAMTLPTLITSVRTKANATKKEVFKARLLNGLKETAVQDTLMGYESTMEFVQVLGKHYKMFNVCDISDINACYNVEEVVLNDKGDTLKVSMINKAENLNLEDNIGFQWMSPVAIVATDGSVLVLSYNKKCAVSEAEIHSKEGSNVDFLCIDGVIDVNGVSLPNKQGQDILPLSNGALVKTLTIPYVKIVYNGETYKVSQQVSDSRLSWSTANARCKLVGGRLPSINELQTIQKFKGRLSLINSTAYFWSSTELDSSSAYAVTLGNGSSKSASKTNGYYVLCLGD